MYHSSPHLIKLIIFSLLFMFFPMTSFSQERTNSENTSDIQISHISYIVDWTQKYIQVDISLAWGVSPYQYTNPNTAVTIAQKNIPLIFSKLISNIYVKEQETLLDFARQHSLYRTILSHLVEFSTHSQIPESNLLGTILSYHIPIVALEQKIVYPSIRTLGIPSVPNVNMQKEDAYTSIIFSVESPLPVITPNTQQSYLTMFSPKILPRVYNEDRNTVVYTPEYFQQTKVNNRAFYYIYRQQYNEAPTGENPLYITPIALDNEEHGDIIISEENTQYILASQPVKNLIQTGKVFFVIPSPEKKEIE